MEGLFNAFGWLLSIVAVSGNGFVVFLVAKNRRLHSSANWFVLSLAVADFCVGIAVFPSSYFCINSMACNLRVYIAFFWFFVHSSVTNLCTLTWDRYNAIIHPFKYNTSITKRRPGMVILAAWLIAFSTLLLLFVETYAVESKTFKKILRIASVSVFDIISCALLLYAVVRILMVARARSHQEPTTELQVQSYHLPIEAGNSRRHRIQSSVPFIIAIVVFFLGCYMVVNSLVLCNTFSCQVSDIAGQVVTCLLVLNSAANPLVYALLKRDMKKEISKIIYKGNNNRAS
ncbi:octopamine receptor beta-2R-like [Oculina patagonica]